MKALLRRFVKEKKSGNILPVIPVLLPGAPASVKLPLFLEEFTWVDLRNGLTKDGLDKLVWGITGMKPMESPATPQREGIFISNQTTDNWLRDELRTVLEADPQLGPRVWDFSKVKPSENFEEIIQDRVSRTKVMIVLASPEYLAPTCWAWEQEFLPAIEALKRGELKIIWLVSRSVDHSKTPLKNILAALPPKEPVAVMSPEKRAAAWLKVRDHVKDALGIASTVGTNESQSPKSPAQTPRVETSRISTTESRHDMSEPKNGRYLTWLHLSDLHFCKDKTGWDAHRVLRPLKEDLKAMEAEHGLCPQFLFFTGDAAFGNIGNVPGSTLNEQFDGAEEVLEGARNAFSTPIQKVNVFIVPGNHDVDRNEIAADQTEWLAKRIDPSEIVNLIKKGGKQWQRYLERLDAYQTFLTRFDYQHLLSDSQRLIYSQIRDVHGLKLGIAGFNSAWSCGAHDTKGGLWFGGDWQAGELVHQLANVDFRVALIHHPFGWFVESEDTPLRIPFERDFAFHLHGHEHQGWVDTKADGHVRVAAAACYQTSQMENGYNFVRIDLDTGDGEVWLRRYDAQGGGWVPRIVKGKTDNNGRWQLRQLSWLKALIAKSSAANP